MSIRIGSVAPDFEADSTQGRIRFHQWIGSSWCVLFSHPKDFTPVCTTELGYMARLKPEFERRNCKIAGLSVDRVEDHARWLDDIKAVTGTAPNYPLIGDPELRIADQRIVGRGTGHCLDVIEPARVVFHTVDAQAGDLAVAALEFGLETRHVAELGGAHGREVLRMREQHAPGAADPLMETDASLGAVRLKVGRDAADANTH